MMMMSESAQLTAQQLKILELSWKGFGTKETAALMGLSFRTVKNYRQDIFMKFGVHNVEGMLRVGVESGLIKVQSRNGEDWP